ncbi:MAG: ATP-binding protein [Actinomycetota bacterium]
MSGSQQPTREASEADPQAWSVDGQTFAFLAPLGVDLPLGAFVIIDVNGAACLGQILDREVADGDHGVARSARGVGRLYMPSDEVQAAGSSGFPASPLRLASIDEVRECGVLEAGTALEVGSTDVGAGSIPTHIKAGGFTRHTFLCGQSGSGKTYATGVILERLAVETSLRMIVIDPNGDYRSLSESRDDADPAAAARLAEIGDRIQLHAERAELGPPKIRIADLTPAAQLALLRLDPVADREELATLLTLHERRSLGEDPQLLQAALNDPENSDPLAMRIRALGIGTWRTWALGQPSILDRLDGPTDVTVLDVSAVDRAEEMYAMAAATLDRLWERRSDRIPTLIAIDEAHHLCTAQPDGLLQAYVTDRLVQIAGEGRKYGLHLLLATQRPAKLHPNVMSQCDNLILLRMNSLADLVDVRSMFGFAPHGLIAQAVNFRKGDALIAGEISPVPQRMRFGGRVSAEGGSDIPTDWTRPRADA